MRYLRWFIPALLLAVGSLTAQEAVHERRAADPDGEVEIESLAGSIRVIGWDRAEVEVTGTLGREAERLEIDADGDSTSIEVILRTGKHRNVEGTHLEVRVPRGSSLSVETISASIAVEGLEDEVELETISGTLTIHGALREVALETISGSIEVHDSPRRAEIETVSGRITLEDGSQLEDGEFHSVSGSIHATADFVAGGRFDFETVSGTIELRIPSRASVEVDVETFSGAIQSDFGKPTGGGGFMPGKELSFSTGSGGARISIRSFSGKIRIRGE